VCVCVCVCVFGWVGGCGVQKRLKDPIHPSQTRPTAVIHGLGWMLHCALGFCFHLGTGGLCRWQCTDGLLLCAVMGVGGSAQTSCCFVLLDVGGSELTGCCFVLLDVVG
jgi:hypothetical protein